MKKWLGLLTALLLAVAPAALAENRTPLPLGVTFQMDGPQLAAHLGGDAAFEPAFEDVDADVGSVEVYGVAFDGLETSYALFDIQRNNSQKTPRLNMITAYLPVGESSVASFRAALESLTALYGAPDSDPFDEASVESYVEYGGLDASWTKADVRIVLSMQRMYDEALSLTFSDRLCYNADDLK